MASDSLGAVVVCEEDGENEVCVLGVVEMVGVTKVLEWSVELNDWEGKEEVINGWVVILAVREILLDDVWT